MATTNPLKFNVTNNANVGANFSLQTSSIIIEVNGVNPSQTDIGQYQIYTLEADGTTTVVSKGTIKPGSLTNAVPVSASTYLWINFPVSEDIGEGPASYNNIVTPLPSAPTGYTPPVTTGLSFNYKLTSSTTPVTYTFNGVYNVIIEEVDITIGYITGSYTPPSGTGGQIDTRSEVNNSFLVPYNTAFTLTAVPAAGYTFTSWSQGQAPPSSVGQNSMVSAIFTEDGNVPKPSKRTWEIIGGVTAGVVIIIIIAIIIYLLARRKQ